MKNEKSWIEKNRYMIPHIIENKTRVKILVKLIEFGEYAGKVVIEHGEMPKMAYDHHGKMAKSLKTTKQNMDYHCRYLENFKILRRVQFKKPNMLFWKFNFVEMPKWCELVKNEIEMSHPIAEVHY